MEAQPLKAEKNYLINKDGYEVEGKVRDQSKAKANRGFAGGSKELGKKIL